MGEALRPLIEAAREGDRQALNALAGCVDRFVRIHKKTISSHLRRTYGSTVDFVLEGLAEAMGRLSSFEYQSDEQFFSWVSHYIRNRIVDAARQERAAKRAGRPVPLAAAREPRSPAPGASSVLFRDELRDAIGKAVLELQIPHPREMEAVVLKLFDNRSWPMIRDHFHLSSDKKARVLFARGLDLLRPLVKERLGESVIRELLGSGNS